MAAISPLGMFFLLICFSSLLTLPVYGFILSTQQRHHTNLVKSNQYFDKSSIKSSNNVEEFAAPEISSKISDSDDNLNLDFDKLSEESAKQAFEPKTDISDMYVKEERKAPRQAQWFPMLLSPSALDGSLAGDVGFDPLGFSSDKPALIRMREAEIKHSRLAMLAAAGWPLSELWHRQIADAIGLDSILSAEGKAPSILNGGLNNEWIIGTAVFSLIVGGVLEFTTYQASQKSDYVPGNLGFDPLRLYTFRSSFGLDQIMEKLTREQKISRAKFDMELSEIKHGRLSMLAVSAYAAQEFVSGQPVVLQTPFFFGDPLL